jgi:hypothetical protein
MHNNILKLSSFHIFKLIAKIHIYNYIYTISGVQCLMEAF